MAFTQNVMQAIRNHFNLDEEVEVINLPEETEQEELDK